jgi:hypothetical protein
MNRNLSFQQYANIPSAIISDGIIPIPLWAVTQLKLDEEYKLPAIGSTSQKAVVPVHDDTITLNGVLVGWERYVWKFALERLAEASRRGSALAAFTGGAASGLILITSLTIRTDMFVKRLTFDVTTEKRDAIGVVIQLAHLPKPGSLSTLLDVAALGVAALADYGGN